MKKTIGLAEYISQGSRAITSRAGHQSGGVEKSAIFAPNVDFTSHTTFKSICKFIL